MTAVPLCDTCMELVIIRSIIVWLPFILNLVIWVISCLSPRCAHMFLTLVLLGLNCLKSVLKSPIIYDSGYFAESILLNASESSVIALGRLPKGGPIDISYYQPSHIRVGDDYPLELQIGITYIILTEFSVSVCNSMFNISD